MWRLKSRWHWPRATTACCAAARPLQARHRGGLHPREPRRGRRQFVGAEFGGIQVKALDEHTLLDGRRLLVTHGDQFDIVVRGGRLLPMLGAKGYNLLLAANKPFNEVRRRMGLPYASLSRRVKHSVKAACKHISNFEELLMLEAEDRGLDGVVCGHIHHPRLPPAGGAPRAAGRLLQLRRLGGGRHRRTGGAHRRAAGADRRGGGASPKTRRRRVRPRPGRGSGASLDELIAYGRVFPRRCEPPPPPAGPASRSSCRRRSTCPGRR